ncbi:MAG: hypothetical protein KBI30_03450 [Candidatus Atribacteria bacterium]|nr:hypothetical protein [Candidatus Atribacteria bacterium]
MSIDIVREKIISSAKSKAEEMKKKAQEEIDAELKKFEQTLEYEFNEKLAEKRKEIDEEIKREKSVELLKLDREKLFKKKEIMDKFFSLLFEEIKKDEKKYLAFMLSLIKRDAVQNSIIFLNEEDYKNIGDKVKDFISKQLKNKNIALADTFADINGGCIIKTTDFEIDDSVESIINDFKEAKEIEIAGELFSNE